MAPIPVSCLGWFCLGYHLADLPSRVASIRSLIVASGLVADDIATENNIAEVLRRILDSAPNIITSHTRPFAAGNEFVIERQNLG